MRFLAVVLCFLTALPGAASGQQQSDYWFVAVSHSDSGRGYSATFIDTTRITRRDPFVRAWLEAYIAVDAPPVMARVSRLVMLKEYDCVEGRERTLQITAYHRNEDPPLTTTNASEWEYPTPQTAGETVLVFVCASQTARQRDEGFVQLPGGFTPAEAATAIFARR